jgi:hypothetical protein
VKRLMQAAFGFLPAVVACSNGAPAVGSDNCPNVSQSCPALPPSWMKDVQPLIEGYCAACHRPGGTGQASDLTTFANVYAHRTEVLFQVYTCRMPLLGASPPLAALSDAQREAIVAWVACGAQNN